MSEDRKIYGIIPYELVNINPAMGEVIKARVVSSTPVVEFYPALPKFNLGSGSLFTMDQIEGLELLKNILFSAGVELDVSPPIMYAIQANSLNIDEGLTNSYTDSYFESVVNAPSRMFREIARVTGKRTVHEMVTTLPESMSGPYSESLRNVLANLSSRISSGQGRLSKGLNIVSSVLAGGRIDFPSIWEASNYSSTVSFTIRLINPYPTSDKYYREYIVYPLAILMAMAVPVSQDEFTYNFPLLVRVRCHKLFDIRAGAITSLKISKGGDEGLIRFKEYAPYVVDVNVVIESLYSSLVAVLGKSVNPERPTLEGYIESMTASGASAGVAPLDVVSSEGGILSSLWNMTVNVIKSPFYTVGLVD